MKTGTKKKLNQKNDLLIGRTVYPFEYNKNNPMSDRGFERWREYIKRTVFFNETKENGDFIAVEIIVDKSAPRMIKEIIESVIMGENVLMQAKEIIKNGGNHAR